MAPHFFIIFCLLAFSKGHDFDKAVEKLENKAWVVEKECINDSCYHYTVNDSNFYFFSKNTFETNSHYGGYCGHYNDFRYIENPVTDVVELRVNVCVPEICFINKVTENSFNVIVLSEMGRSKTMLTFISDSEFVLDHGKADGVKYYKLIPTPKDIFGVDK
jgi:hypothetical protein